MSRTIKKKAKAWAKVDREAVKASKRIAYARHFINPTRWGFGSPIKRAAHLQEIVYYQTLRYERLKAKAKAFG